MKLSWSPQMADTNYTASYTSGDDYVVKYLGYRLAFNTNDFEQRVVAAAAKLGLVEANELEDEETNDLVSLAVSRGSWTSRNRVSGATSSATGSACR